MDTSFQQGFEKTAVLGSAVSFIGKKTFQTMPKIFKKMTFKNGKFSPGRAMGAGLGTAFGAMEVGRVAGEARKAANRSTKTMIPRSWNV